MWALTSGIPQLQLPPLAALTTPIFYASRRIRDICRSSNTQSLHVEIVHAVAGANAGTINASMVGENGTSAVVESNRELEVVAIADLTTRAVDLLKIDTDGFELQVLHGASKLLEQRAIAVFTEYSPQHIRHYGKVEPTDVLSLMHEAGFRKVLVYDNIGTPIGILPTRGDAMVKLSDYSERRRTWYYLDLLFDRNLDRLDAFFAEECLRIPKVPP
jgi:FkbM family methyltransferase